MRRQRYDASLHEPSAWHEAQTSINVILFWLPCANKRIFGREYEAMIFETMLGKT